MKNKEMFATISTLRAQVKRLREIVVALGDEYLPGNWEADYLDLLYGLIPGEEFDIPQGEFTGGEEIFRDEPNPDLPTGEYHGGEEIESEPCELPPGYFV